MSKKDIIIAGVGGQGILSIAAVTGLAAIMEGQYLKQAEVHGMSQRGGAVQSHLRLSLKRISSDIIPEGEADLIIALEPMESLRYLSFLKPDGWLISNSNPYINIPDYPDIQNILEEIQAFKNHILIDADQIARDSGSIRTSNMVVLGAASRFLNLQERSLYHGISELFGKKGEKVVEMNIRAFNNGKN